MRDNGKADSCARTRRIRVFLSPQPRALIPPESDRGNAENTIERSQKSFQSGVKDRRPEFTLFFPFLFFFSWLFAVAELIEER